MPWFSNVHFVTDNFLSQYQGWTSLGLRTVLSVLRTAVSLILPLGDLRGFICEVRALRSLWPVVLS